MAEDQSSESSDSSLQENIAEPRSNVTQCREHKHKQENIAEPRSNVTQRQERKQNIHSDILHWNQLHKQLKSPPRNPVSPPRNPKSPPRNPKSPPRNPKSPPRNPKLPPRAQVLGLYHLKNWRVVSMFDTGDGGWLEN